MKFNCHYRAKDGSRKVVELDAIDRREAFCQAKQMGLNVIEMVSDGKARKKPPARERKNVKIEVSNPECEETAIYKQREHSYILGVLFGPIGFLISSLIWKHRGMKYGSYGLGMSVITFIAGYLFGIIGLIAGLVASVLIENVIIPKPNKEKAEWDNL